MSFFFFLFMRLMSTGKVAIENLQHFSRFLEESQSTERGLAIH
jgi:hypothetical protein